jgi:hypothetical protein
LTHLIVLDEKVEYRWWQIISSTNKSLQWLSANFKEKLQKYIKKWYKIFEIKVYQRLFYPLEKWKRSVVYLFQLDLRK